MGWNLFQRAVDKFNANINPDLTQQGHVEPGGSGDIPKIIIQMSQVTDVQDNKYTIALTDEQYDIFFDDKTTEVYIDTADAFGLSAILQKNAFVPEDEEQDLSAIYIYTTGPVKKEGTIAGEIDGSCTFLRAVVSNTPSGKIAEIYMHSFDLSKEPEDVYQTITFTEAMIKTHETGTNEWVFTLSDYDWNLIKDSNNYIDYRFDLTNITDVKMWFYVSRRVDTFRSGTNYGFFSAIILNEYDKPVLYSFSYGTESSMENEVTFKIVNLAVGST